MHKYARSSGSSSSGGSWHALGTRLRFELLLRSATLANQLAHAHCGNFHLGPENSIVPALHLIVVVIAVDGTTTFAATAAQPSVTRFVLVDVAMQVSWPRASE